MANQLSSVARGVAVSVKGIAQPTYGFQSLQGDGAGGGGFAGVEQ